MKFLNKKVMITLIILVFFILLLIFIPRNKLEDFRDKYSDLNETNQVVDGLGRSNTYAEYLSAHSDKGYPDKDISINIGKFSNSRGVEFLSEYEGKDNILLTSDDSYVEWDVFVEEAGMYQMNISYYPVKSRGVDIERKLYINGEIPFFGADALSLTRMWTNKGEVRKDNQGNDIRPSQVEAPSWTSTYFKDDRGYYSEPYMFYLEEGMNKVALEVVNEPLAINDLTFTAVKERIHYSTYKESLPNNTASELALNYKEVVQGEDSTLRSAPSLYAIYDRSAPNTEPYSVSKIRLNMIGGNAYRVPGQWIEWKFSVPEDGIYNITVKGRQNYNRGFVSTRAVYLDGELPFKEMEQVSFKFSNEWESVTLADNEGNPYDFYLTEGEHTIRMEVTLGDLGNILNEMDESVYRLNEMYRKILVLTGSNPDKYRDYKIETTYPEVIEGMRIESKRLFKIIDDLVEYSGQKGNQAGTVQTLAEQLEKFVKAPHKIPQIFVNFKENISAFGTAILSLSEAPLDIDYITITGLEEKPDKVKATAFDKTIHEIRSFVASFTEDYNAVGNIHAEEESIEVWILTGRDQSTILKTMIDDTFTPNNNIYVNVKLVEPATLLNAVISGTGPDVVISAGQGEPVNYALRNAVEDITQFNDYKEVLSEYHESSYEPYRFENGIYAIPETQNFNVLFYRTDIFEELEIKVPDTWDDFVNILPVIQQKNMTVAVPSGEFSVLLGMHYQNGGVLYDEIGTKTLISSESGIAAFDTYTNLFTQYKLPLVYDFPNRFRSGEMPMGIQDYNMFNTLAVFAPEIRGLWDFAMIPGVLKEDGTIDRSIHTTGLCSMLLKQEDESVKDKAWVFLKWWSSAETQLRFGIEMESVMGAAARYATANTKAFEQLAWSSSQMDVLRGQREWAVGYREVAGGYYTGRHILNAVRKVINANEDPRETILDYSRTINEEIEKKRLEFGLDNR